MKVTNWLRKFECRSSKRHRVMASLAAAGVASLGSIAQADTSTTLTGLTTPGNVDVPNTHGDNAEVDLTWNSNWDQYGTLNYAGGWDGRGDVYQMEYNTQTIVFDPTDIHNAVSIQELELDEWAGGGNTSSTWEVRSAAGRLVASGNWNLKNNANDPNDLGGRDLIAINAQGNPGEKLILSFNNLDSLNGGGYDSYLAMDNLVFHTTVVPEPATALIAWMGVGGLGALAMRRKRK
jgi:hypothetical protein